MPRAASAARAAKRLDVGGAPGSSFRLRRVVGRGDGEADRRVDPADVGQDVGVAHDQVALGDDVDGEAVVRDDLQRATGQVELRFQRHVWIVHRAGADGALDPFARQLIPQQIERVGLHQHVVVEVLDLVALAARVAVDALVLAAPVQVHGVFDPEPGIGLLGAGEQRLGGDLFDHSSHSLARGGSADKRGKPGWVGVHVHTDDCAWLGRRPARAVAGAPMASSPQAPSDGCAARW